MSAILLSGLIVGCVCGGAPLFSDSIVQRLAAGRTVADRDALDGRDAAWIGECTGILRGSRGERYLRYRYLKARDIEGLLRRLRFLEDLKVERDELATTDLEFLVDSRYLDDDGSNACEYARAQGTVVLAGATWVSSDGRALIARRFPVCRVTILDRRH